MNLVSRASRVGLTVGSFLILCCGLCTAQRFHTEEHDNKWHVGCPNEPDSLTHHVECTKLCNIFLSGDMPQYCHKEIISYTTWSLVCKCKAFNTKFWYWVSLTLLFMPIISTAKVWRILEILVSAWKEGLALWRPSLLPTLTHIRQLVLLCRYLQSRTKTSAYQNQKPDIHIFPKPVP